MLLDVLVELTVRIRDKEKGTWPLKAKVIEKDKTPRSFVVESEKGTTLQRNRQDLLLTNEKFVQEPNYDDIDIPVNDSTEMANDEESPQSNPSIEIEGTAEPSLNQGSSAIQQNNYRTSSRTCRPPKRYGFDD